jgi:hypothetical protein
MRENRPSGSEGGAGENPLFLPLSLTLNSSGLNLLKGLTESAGQAQGAGSSVPREILVCRTPSSSNQMGSMARKRWKFCSAFHFW